MKTEQVVRPDDITIELWKLFLEDDYQIHAGVQINELIRRVQNIYSCIQK